MAGGRTWAGIELRQPKLTVAGSIYGRKQSCVGAYSRGEFSLRRWSRKALAVLQNRQPFNIWYLCRLRRMEQRDQLPLTIATIVQAPAPVARALFTVRQSVESVSSESAGALPLRSRLTS